MTHKAAFAFLFNYLHKRNKNKLQFLSARNYKTLFWQEESIAYSILS